MKKDRNGNGGPPRIAQGRPAKPAESEARPPAYDGRAKTDDMPAAEGGRTKDAFAAPDPAEPAGGYDDQQPKPGAEQRVAAPAEQYVRLRVRVRDDQLSVVDSHLVDGPLGQTNRFTGTHAYEVTVGDRLVHAGALPDLGVQRSFVNPGGPPEQQAHHLAERRTVEFMARVPANEVTPETIGEIAIRLHRIKDSAGTDRLGAAPLGAQFEREIRQVAEVVGLPDSVLPDAIEARGAHTPSV
ncbi:hypothetical protein [Actinocrispum sp. NPDC049592]|uniref:hypothetical protein n=1 Tax=Actinocrispum sp. NPDC049592 TaxID=3154835 RepID=UPI00341DD546